MATEDPWLDVVPPAENSRISARRVADVGTPSWGLYWALDTQHQCLLVLQHHSEHSHSRRLPRLRGLRIESHPAEDSSGERLIIRLTDSSQREVFHRFCRDLVEATCPSLTDEEAVERFLSRTYRWHRLLQSRSDDRLTVEEQKGLIGELCVLEHHLLPVVGPVGAVQAWIGPLDAPKDFLVGWVGIEAKTRSPHIPTVRVSSADQLDSAGTARLFLHVLDISEASTLSTSVTVTDVASQVREAISSRDMSALIQFEERLNAVGFDWSDDYSDSPVSVGRASLFEIIDGFPRITPAMCCSGVQNVTYSIMLSKCEKFRVDMTALSQAISGGSDES